MGESSIIAGGLDQTERKRCIQFIHNRMVVDYPQMSSVDFGVPDFCFLIMTDTWANLCSPCAAYRSWVRMV